MNQSLYTMNQPLYTEDGKFFYCRIASYCNNCEKQKLIKYSISVTEYDNIIKRIKEIMRFELKGDSRRNCEGDRMFGINMNDLLMYVYHLASELVIEN